VPNVPTISLPHAANFQQSHRSPLSVVNNNLNTSTLNLTENNIQPNKFVQNKWAQMSTHIQYNIKSVSTNATSNLINSVDNKWTKMTNTIILSSTYKSKRSNKRIGSPNLQNKWIEQDDQVIKRKKNQILTYQK